jgi:hypothetical protein
MRHANGPTGGREPFLRCVRCSTTLSTTGSSTTTRSPDSGSPSRRAARASRSLTPKEINQLAEVAVQVHGEEFGRELAAMILWGAYTCMRPGESFAARYTLSEGDVYYVERQFNSTLRREVAPKHNSVGTIYVPEPARRAVLDKPRRLAMT